jgi:hypothetical protein
MRIPGLKPGAIDTCRKVGLPTFLLSEDRNELPRNSFHPGWLGAAVLIKLDIG